MSILFTQSLNWPLSKLKNGKAIVDKYGYIPENYTHKCLHVTLSTLKPTPQGLGLNVDYAKDWLEANEYALTANADGSYKKLDDVSVWQLLPLHEDVLLEQGKITVDFLLCRNSGGDTYSFKVGKRDRALLFPESETYIINSIG